MEILIVDIETTGFFNQGGKIVEIGIVSLNLQNGHKEILFDKVCKEKGISEEEIRNSWIVQNSDLTAAEIMQADDLEILKPEIQKIIDSYPAGITAYNNQFDFQFLENRGIKLRKKLDCPMLLATDICRIPSYYGSGYKWPKVQEAWDYFFGRTGYIEKHRGADDAHHEADIVYYLYRKGVFTL